MEITEYVMERVCYDQDHLNLVERYRKTYLSLLELFNAHDIDGSFESETQKFNMFCYISLPLEHAETLEGFSLEEYKATREQHPRIAAKSNPWIKMIDKFVKTLDLIVTVEN